MRGFFPLICVAAIVASFVAACSTTDDSPAGPDPNAFHDLTHRDDVIVNLRLAYEQASMTQVDRLLHDTFKFCYTVDSATRCWPRDEDVAITRAMLASDAQTPTSTSPVDVTFTYPAGDAEWILTAPRDPGNESGAALYEKTVDYRITISDGTSESTADGRATFVIRTEVIDATTVWRLVLVSDHTGGWGSTKEPFSSALR